MNNKKVAGIWLDFKEAYLIVLAEPGSDLPPKVHHFPSDIHHETAKGGSRSKAPWGPQGPTDERKILEHRKHAEKAYFDKILDGMGPLNLDEIIIFGPAEAKDRFEDALLADKKHPKPHIKALLTANYMTVPEMAARVGELYDLRAV
jgi:hypothetical protein